MALTILTEPGDLVLCRNPVALKVQTDAYFTQQLVYAELVFQVDAELANGEWFRFQWNGGASSVTLTAVASPDQTGTQVQDDSFVGSLASYGEHIAEMMAFNPDLFADYRIAFDKPNLQITLTARSMGSAYNLPLTTSSAALQQISSTLYQEAVTETDFRIALDLYIEDVPGSGAFDFVLRETMVPDDESEVTFDLSSKLLAYLSYDHFDVAMLGAQPLVQARKHYRYRLAEIYGDPAIEQWSEMSGIKQAVHAGLNHTAFPGADIIAYFQATAQFLTWQPNFKPVTRFDPEFLSFLLVDVITSPLTMKVRQHLVGQQFTNTVLTVSNPGQYEAFTFPVGLDRIETILGQSYGDPYKYEVWLEDGTQSVISEVRTFELIPHTQRFTRYFLFQNSFGVMDTLRAYGTSTLRHQSKQLLTSSMLDVDYSAEQGSLSRVSAVAHNAVTVNTGNSSKAYIEHLQEMLHSDHVFEVINGKWLPIIIETRNVKLHQSDQQLYNFEFSYRYAFNEPAHTSL